MGKFWRREVEALIYSVLWEQCGDEMSKVVEDDKGNAVIEGRKRI